jgi:lipopolysaccharide export system protein LptA
VNRSAAAFIIAAMISAVPPARAASPTPTPPHPVSTSPASTSPASTAPSGPPNALQGFSQNRDKPLKITSVSLEVRDKDKMATFSGDVHLVQGDTTLRSKTLIVFYDDDSDAASKPEAPKPAKPPANANANAEPMSQQIRRVEVKGGVLVTQKDQTATGESGVFDMQANTVTLLGNVVISQGQNVVRGDRLTVDLNSGVSRVECGKTQGQCRVQALIQPNSMKGEKDKPGSESPAATGTVREAPRDAPRPRSPTSGLY